MGGEAEGEDVGEVPPRLEAATGDDVCGQRQRPDCLDRSGREPVLTQRPPVAAPATRGLRRFALPQRVVEEAEEGDAEQVGQPAAQLWGEQVEVGTVVEEGERRQREQGGRRQHGAKREGEPDTAVVLAHQPSVEQPAHPCRHDQQRQHEGDREADPAHRRSGARRSGRRLSALLLTPKLPSAPSKASTAARRPATRSMSSTLGRLLLPKKEIEEGSASTVSTPTAGTRVAEMPLISADSRRPAVEPCSWPIDSGWWRTTITPSSPPKLPLAREKMLLRTCSSRVPPRTSWRPTLSPNVVCKSGSRRSRAKRVAERSLASERMSTGSRTTPTATSRAPVESRASSTASETSAGRSPSPTRPIRCPARRGRTRTDRK